ncbi:dephospho-CoA kinase [bacterium]|nr:dephospho-CoA kinase [bacterium]
MGEPPASIALGGNILLTLGWTGGIASGKTTALELLGKLVHLEILEADGLGHALLREPRIRGAIVDICGRDVLDTNGELDRQLLGKRVFGDKDIRARYNALVHPPLIERIRDAVDEARARNNSETFVVDSALIFEWEIEDIFDAVVAVRAARGLALRRLKRTGLSETEARQRLNSQLREDLKVKRADFVIINDDDREALERRVRFFWEHQLAPLRKGQAP